MIGRANQYSAAGLGRIDFAMATAAFFFCKIVLLYVSFDRDDFNTVSASAGYIDLALLVIVLILIPAALRFHDFNRSAKWPVLIIVLVGSTLATVVTTVLVLSSAAVRQTLNQPEITFELTFRRLRQAFLLLPFWVVVAIGLFVPGTAGTNRFGEPAKSILGGGKRSD